MRCMELNTYMKTDRNPISSRKLEVYSFQKGLFMTELRHEVTVAAGQSISFNHQ